jgi:hypothetical protein
VGTFFDETYTSLASGREPVARHSSKVENLLFSFAIISASSRIVSKGCGSKIGPTHDTRPFKDIDE